MRPARRRCSRSATWRCGPAGTATAAPPERLVVRCPAGGPLGRPRPERRRQDLAARRAWPGSSRSRPAASGSTARISRTGSRRGSPSDAPGARSSGATPFRRRSATTARLARDRSGWWGAPWSGAADNATSMPCSPAWTSRRWRMPTCARCPAANASASRSPRRCCRARRLLLLDEPAAHLDLGHQHQLLDLLEEHAAARRLGRRQPARPQPRLGPGQPCRPSRRPRRRAGRAPRRPDDAGAAGARSSACPCSRRFSTPADGSGPAGATDPVRALMRCLIRRCEFRRAEADPVVGPPRVPAAPFAGNGALHRRRTLVSTVVRSLAQRGLALFAAIGIVAASVQAAGTDLVVDDAGRGVAVLRQGARVVTLAPSLTELVYAVGAGPALVGTVGHSDFPPAARSVPRIGDYQRFDVERILALKPDLVLVWNHGNPGREVAQLEAAGLRLFYLEPRRLDDVAARARTCRCAARSGGAGPGPGAGAARRDRRPAPLPCGRGPGLGLLPGLGESADDPRRGPDRQRRHRAVRRAQCLRDAAASWRRSCRRNRSSRRTRRRSSWRARTRPSAPGPSAIPTIPPLPSGGVIAISSRCDSGWLYTLPGDAITRQGPRIVEGARAVCAALDQVRSERDEVRRKVDAKRR